MVLEIVAPAIGSLIAIGLVKKTTDIIEGPKGLKGIRPRIKEPLGFQVRKFEAKAPGIQRPKGRRLTDREIEQPLAPARFSSDVRGIKPR